MIFQQYVPLFPIQNSKKNYKLWRTFVLLKKYSKRIYKYLIQGRDKPNFVINHSDSKKKCSEDYICRMQISWLTICLKCLADVFFDRIVGIPMGANCALVLTYLFLYSYKADFLKRKEKKNLSIFWFHVLLYTRCSFTQ